MQLSIYTFVVYQISLLHKILQNCTNQINYFTELSKLGKNFESDDDLEQVQNINDYNLILLNNYQKNKFQSRKNEFDFNYFNDNPLEKYLM